MVGRVILEVGELTHNVLEGDPQPRGGLRLGDCGGEGERLRSESEGEGEARVGFEGDGEKEGEREGETAAR